MKHKELIEKMTVMEKAAFLTGYNQWATRAYDHLNIPTLTFSDGPTGVRRQKGNGDHLGLNPSEPATCFPSPSTLANSWDEELEEKVGEGLGKEVVLNDVDVLLAPGMNIKRNPLCGRNFEYFSEDPYLSGKMAAAMIRGLQKNGAGASVKHFAVNSQEERRMAMNAVIDERTLREIYLTGFEIAVKEGKPKSVMSSYNEINGVYANENAFLLKDILRNEWGFEGFVVTDWGGGNDYTEGVKNGSNIQMPGCGLDSARQLLKAFEENKITQEEIDARVDELLDGVLTIPQSTKVEKDRLAPVKEQVLDHNHQLAIEAAENSAVLLKNDNNILPLKSNSKIAIIGDFAFDPRYQGAGSSNVNATKVETLKDYVNDKSVIGMAKGYRRNGKEDSTLEKEALELASKADTVVYLLGLCEKDETEGRDRSHIDLATNQLTLLHKIAKVNRNVVGVLIGGSVVSTWWKKDCRALLYVGLSGQAGAIATWNLLTGKINPSGKLTESWIEKYTDTPSYQDYPAKDHNLYYSEGIFVGYRYFERENKQVAYPFGYGLSYTPFTYSDLKVNEKGIKVTIENTGEVDGKEIIQMYISLPNSHVIRPIKELKGFAKVDLKAHEKKEVSILFDDKTFRFFSLETGKWEIEKGTYQILVGASSQDIRLTQELEVQGTYEISRSQTILDIKKAIDKTTSTNKYYDLQRNDSISQMTHAKNPIARLIAKIMKGQIEKGEKRGDSPNLNLLFTYHMPFRAIGKMTAGAVSMEMVDGIVDIVNGHFFKGVGIVIAGFFRNKKKNNEYEAILKNQATGKDREKVVM